MKKKINKIFSEKSWDKFVKEMDEFIKQEDKKRQEDKKQKGVTNERFQKVHL